MTPRRVQALAAAAAAVAFVALLAPWDDARVLPCRVMPNGHIALVPDLRARCPLRPVEAVVGVAWRERGAARQGDLAELPSAVARSEGPLELRVRRAGREEWVSVAVLARSRAERWGGAAAALLVSAALVALPVLLRRRGPRPAGLPFAAFCAALAFLLLGAVSGARSPWLHRLETAALVLLPCALAHLCLALPARPPIAARLPFLERLPYAAGAALLPVALRALERDALVWPAVCGLLVALAAAFWLVLVAVCGVASRSGGAARERARARALLCGVLLLPLPPASLLLDASAESRHAAAQALLGSLALVPLPLALAASDRTLFALGSDARRLSARLLVYAAAGLVGTALFAVSHALLGEPWSVRSPLALFVTCIGCAALAEGVRAAASDPVERALLVRESRLQRLRQDFSREAARVEGEGAVARRLAAVLAQGLEAGAGAVFAAGPPGWRPLAAFGPRPPLDRAAAERAASRLAGGAICDLAAEGGAAPSGVVLFAGLRCQGRLLGVALLGAAARGPYTRPDLEFAEDVCARAAAALANAGVFEEALDLERQAAAGRAALALAHDVGKELDWLCRLARRLPERLADAARARRDALLLADLAADLARSVRAFVRDAAAGAVQPARRVALADLLDRAARELVRRHPGPPPVCTVESAARTVRVDPALCQVLANLLDNAVHAQPPGVPVQVFATREAGALRIEVRDRGAGLSAEALARAFEPGFTTRAERGGCGVGLAIAREVVASLGGRVSLRCARGGGTCAAVELPCGA